MAQAFQGNSIPESCKLIGWAWLTQKLRLKVPLRELSCISTKRLSSQSTKKGPWIIFDSLLAVDDTIWGHLEFALKHESLDILVLKFILNSCRADEIVDCINKNPRGIYSKKIWFWYEYLLDNKLPLKDLPPGKYDDLINEKKYFTLTKSKKSKRHKINNNSLGHSKFCPIIKKTDKLVHLSNKNLHKKIDQTLTQVSKSVLRRAASFLLLSDSKASFEIEGERPPKNRIERWGKVINQAGKPSCCFD